MQKILNKARQLVDVKKDDGFAALHLAALNGHLRTAETLIDVVRLSLIVYFLILATNVFFQPHIGFVVASRKSSGERHSDYWNGLLQAHRPCRFSTSKVEIGITVFILVCT